MSLVVRPLVSLTVGGDQGFNRSSRQPAEGLPKRGSQAGEGDARLGGDCRDGRNQAKLGIMRGLTPDPMLRRLWIGLLASAVAIAPLPLRAQDGSAEDLGDAMSISLKDVVKPTFGFQGALQGAGTPNQAGIGGFLPLSVGDNSVWFVDALILSLIHI